MFTRTTACPACGEPASTCTVWAMYPPRGTPPRRKCCPSCHHAEGRVEHPEPPQLPPPDGPSTPMSPGEVDVIVAAVLRQAETLGDGQVELFGRATVSAYRSLARSAASGSIPAHTANRPTGVGGRNPWHPRHG